MDGQSWGLPKEAERVKLAQHLREFLLRGGKVEKLGITRTAYSTQAPRAAINNASKQALDRAKERTCAR